MLARGEVAGVRLWDPVRGRPGRLPGAGLALALALLAGCSGPSPLTPLVVTHAQLDGRVVSWSSTKPGAGSVRWGNTARHFDHVSYPAGVTTSTTTHAVPLLAVAAGDSVYLEVAVRATDGTESTGPLEAFRVMQAPATAPCLLWTMIDVGWGDSHLLTLPGSGAHVLVDAGERRDAANVERYLASTGITRLDAVLVTHIHEDHLGGMVGNSWDPGDGVVGRLEVGTVLEGVNHSATRAALDELRSVCTARGIPRTILQAGDDDRGQAALAWDPGVQVEVLHAGGGRALGGATESEWINNDSVVLRITYGAVSLVLGGDAESPVQSTLIASGVPLEAAVLKVHHHGSADASDPGYLDAVRPRIALVPMVSYELGGTLPSGIVLQRLRERGADIFGSDRAEPLGIAPVGDAGQNVTVVTDGRSVELVVEPSASRHWPPDLTAGGVAR